MSEAADPFDRYLASIDSVDGWLANATAHISNRLMKAQSASGISGSVCEIGVHHGRYFIALATGLTGAEVGLAVDLFEEEQESVYGSGDRNREIFRGHLERFVPKTTVHLLRADSMTLEPEKISSLAGPVRFFSVDGGHTASIASNDIALASTVLHPQGIVAVDDVMNAEWTGVLTGIANYLAHDPRLEPIAIIPNKLLMSLPSAVDYYKALLAELFPGKWLGRKSEFLGRDIEVFYDPAPPSESNEHWKREYMRIAGSRRYKLGTALARLIGR